MIEDNLEIIDTGTGYASSLALPSNKSSYAMVGGAGSLDNKDIIFSEELGLAIERPPKGMTID